MLVLLLVSVLKKNERKITKFSSLCEINFYKFPQKPQENNKSATNRSTFLWAFVLWLLLRNLLKSAFQPEIKETVVHHIAFRGMINDVFFA